MKKYLILMITVLTFFAFPLSSMAAGWSYNLKKGQSWGSSTCTTSYKYIKFHIKPTKKGYATAYLQKYSRGKWVDTGPGEDLYAWEQVLSAPADSSSTKYRVFISVGYDGDVAGKIRCYGENKR
ncbi:hypothetical protein ACFO25_05020 [Paenactinomyces guangxiensis]|uniref:Secreted protein n=1 Tax=Paenactinomyces guangxiensis TaxID=1490290 RepID=A0A7W1WPP9_9BACL|nr:hypothetical protein [Paenactinomyces guangxiensis]MBA4493740.1 hypothetical protein [Paenactinomyces guangxiensis]MBH8591028.1 hypothetical protein [Paenactinomyces guangxiensis]